VCLPNWLTLAKADVVQNFIDIHNPNRRCVHLLIVAKFDQIQRCDAFKNDTWKEESRYLMHVGYSSSSERGVCELTCNHWSFGNMSLFWLWYCHRHRILFVARVEWDFAVLPLGSTRELFRLLLVCSVVRSFRPNICIVCHFARLRRLSASSIQSLEREAF
jgi:hypothetical protein